MAIKPAQILLSPLAVIFGVYPGVFFFQLEVVFPTEARLFPVYAKTASLLQAKNYEVVFNGTSLLMAIIGTASAPAAYILLKTVLGNRIYISTAVLNWRYVFLIGIIASAINSVGLVAVYVVPAEMVEIVTLMLRFFIGDIFGLFVGLVVLTYIFRIVRNVRAV